MSRRRVPHQATHPARTARRIVGAGAVGGYVAMTAGIALAAQRDASAVNDVATAAPAASSTIAADPAGTALSGAARPARTVAIVTTTIPNLAFAESTTTFPADFVPIGESATRVSPPPSTARDATMAGTAPPTTSTTTTDAANSDADTDTTAAPQASSPTSSPPTVAAPATSAPTTTTVVPTTTSTTTVAPPTSTTIAPTTTVSDAS